MRKSERWVTGLLAIALAVAACGDQRPSSSEWEADWLALTAVIPTIETIQAGPPDDVCSRTLGEIRNRSDEVIPSPNTTSDELVRDWIAEAEEIFFDCPLYEDSPDFYSSHYEDLANLAQLVVEAANPIQD